MFGNGICTYVVFADHQRAAFHDREARQLNVAGDLQLADIRRVDLIEFGKAGIGVIALLHHPLLRILGHWSKASWRPLRAKPCMAKRPKTEVVTTKNLLIRASSLGFDLKGRWTLPGTQYPHGTSSALSWMIFSDTVSRHLNGITSRASKVRQTVSP